MSLHLSSLSVALGRMSLQFTLVSDNFIFTLVSRSRYLGPHEFTLVFHLSPTLVSHSGCLGPHDFALVSRLSTLVPRHPEWETRVGDKCGRQVGDRWETSVNSCGPRHPEWETSVGEKWKTSVNSCGPTHAECETSVGDKTHAAQDTQSEKQDKCGGQV